MSPFIHFYLILLVYFFINTYSSRQTTPNRCLTFTKIKKKIASSCQILSKPRCLTCNITEINNITNNSCKKNFTCVNLNFPNDSILKYILKNHQKIIYKLFEPNTSNTTKNTFNISLQEFNNTKINKSYIESIFGTDNKPYDALSISVLKHNSNQILPKIDQDLKKVSIHQFYIHIPCNSAGGMIRYNVTKVSVISEEDEICKNSSSTLQKNSTKLDQTTITSNMKKNKTSVVTATQSRSISQTINTKIQSAPSKKAASAIQTDTTIKNEITTVTNRNEANPPTTNTIIRLHQTTQVTQTMSHTKSSAVSTTQMPMTTLELIRTQHTTPQLQTEPTQPESVKTEPITSQLIETEDTKITTDLINPPKNQYAPTSNSKPPHIHTSTFEIKTISPTNTKSSLSTLSTAPSKRFNKLLLLLLIPGLLVLLIIITLIIVYTFFRNRPVPDDIIIETSSNISPVSNSDTSSTNISGTSNAPSFVGSSNVSTTYLSPASLRRNRPVAASNLKMHVARAFDTDF